MVKIEEVENYILKICLRKAMGTQVQGFKGIDGIVIRSIALGNSTEQFSREENHIGEIVKPKDLISGVIVQVTKITNLICPTIDEKFFPSQVESVTIDVLVSDTGDLLSYAEIFEIRFNLKIEDIASLFQRGIALSDVIIVSQENLDEMKVHFIDINDIKSFGLIPVKKPVEVWQ